MENNKDYLDESFAEDSIIEEKNSRDRSDKIPVEEKKTRDRSGKTSKEEKKTSLGREILSFLLYIGVACLLTFLILKFVGQRTVVIGESMENTLFNQESVIVDKLSYRFTDPQRYDIIVFPYQHAKDTYYIKRIIGMPGETVRIDEETGIIYINGKELVESYGKEVIKYAKMAKEEITLGEDEYFVLGDNRNNSQDSRDPLVGKIKRENIIGKAFCICWPLDRFGVIKHQ